MRAIDTSFERAFAEMRADRESRTIEMRAERESHTIVMRAGFAEIRADISALQRQVTQICAGFAVALLGVVAAGIVAAF